MAQTTCEQIELSIWKELAGRHLSASHDRWHVDRVLSFARQLQAIHGGDQEVLTAAVLLHDLGRENPELRGQASIERSIKDAEELLERIGFPGPRRHQVLVAINEHDKPEVRPSTIEGRILKDADFLAGFGAWGIVRIALWAGETKRGIPHVLDRLQHRMPKRLASLEFPQSVRFARLEMLFANLFLARLSRPPQLDGQEVPGTLIVFEGTSGSGKDTQADLLQARLENRGHSVIRVSEPAGQYQKARDTWGSFATDPMIQSFLLAADRYQLSTTEVRPALARGDTVLSVRSFISTLVYQENDVYDSSELAFIHHFVPLPDLVILLDVDAGVAFERCSERARAERRELGVYEQIETLMKHRERYLAIAHGVPIFEMEVVDASRPVKQVAAQVWQAVKTRIL